MENEKNEFDDIDVSEDEVPTTPSEVPGEATGDDSVIDTSTSKVFDTDRLPSGSSAPKRIDLNGKVVKIIKAEIYEPSMNKPLLKTREGDGEYQNCTFKVYYDNEGQVEFYSGIKAFWSPEKRKFGSPSIYKEGTNQAAKLFQAFCKFKGNDPHELNLKELMDGLKSGLLYGKIESQEFKSPDGSKAPMKNIIVEFVTQ